VGRFISEKGGPTPEPGVLRALEAIDPHLSAIWRWNYLDRKTGGDLLRQDGSPIPHPRWHVVLRTKETWTHLFAVEDEEGDFRGLDHRVPAKIRADAGRHLSAEEINRRVDEAKAAIHAASAGKFEDLRALTLKANRKKIGEVLEGQNVNRGVSNNTRDAKIISYRGQPNRRSGFDSIPTTSEEEGWELPDFTKEMASGAD